MTPNNTAVWRHPNVWLLLGGQWVSQMGNVCLTLAAFWYVLRDTHSSQALGWVGAAAALSGLFSLVAGVWVDRWDRRRIMVLTDVLRFVLLAGLGAALLQSPRVPLIAILGVVAAVNLGGAIFSPAQFALVPEVIASPDALAAVNGLDQSATSLAQWVGYSVGGVLLGLVGVAGLVGADAATFFVSAGSLLGLRLPQRPPSQPTAPAPAHAALWHEILAGQRVLWSHPFLKRALPTALMVNFAMMSLTVLDVAWAHQILHGTAAIYGFLESAIVVGAIAGGVVTLRLPRHLTLRPRIMGSLGLAGLALVGMAIHPNVPTSLIALGLIGTAFGVLNATTGAAIQQSVPGPILGRIGGSLMAVTALATPLGAVIAGWAGTEWPLPDVYAVAGVLVAVMAIPYVWIPTTLDAVGAETTGPLETPVNPSTP